MPPVWCTGDVVRCTAIKRRLYIRIERLQSVSGLRVSWQFCASCSQHRRLYSFVRSRNKFHKFVRLSVRPCACSTSTSSQIPPSKSLIERLSLQSNRYVRRRVAFAAETAQLNVQKIERYTSQCRGRSVSSVLCLSVRRNVEECGLARRQSNYAGQRLSHFPRQFCGHVAARVRWQHCGILSVHL